jgi:hypothetical protein
MFVVVVAAALMLVAAAAYRRFQSNSLLRTQPHQEQR